ncbi:MAG: cyclic nucleotide-binding domain-containing protein [Dehalococcoidales bacterium]
MAKFEVLKRCSLVRDLSDEQLKTIAKLAKEETYEVGELLVKQGRTAEKLFLIEDGLVGIYLELGPITHRLLQAASEFEVVGWTSMLPPYRARATAKAIETTKALAFSAKGLIALCEKTPEIGSEIYRSLDTLMARRLDSAFIQLMGVTSQDANL